MPLGMPLPTNSKDKKEETSLRQELFKAGKAALDKAGGDLRETLKGFTGKGKKMDTAESLQLQFEVGEYSNLVQTITGIEKAMKDAITATARNTS